MRIEKELSKYISQAFSDLYGINVCANEIIIQATRSEFVGDFTFVVFPFVKLVKKSPDVLANEIGEFLKEKCELTNSFTVTKGFLNISIKNTTWLQFINKQAKGLEIDEQFENQKNEKPIVIEFSSPNTNKPLHLGHIRNNLLGDSISRIMKRVGHNVVKVNLVNDRGIHICKSMLAWEKWGEGETPKSSGLKGDHLVGKYYVVFDKEYKKQIEELVSQGSSREDAERKAPLILEAQEMLRKWESGDKHVKDLWMTMNSWVYEGFDTTYKILGISFDKTYYESETYLLGKNLVAEGLKNGAFETETDGSVWADLTNEGLDKKILQRADGTSVYMTQDLGTALQRYNEYNPEKLVYVVGNEQEYHFNVLSLILKKLNFDWYDIIHHLSYGMVELPDGKMKSREGTVVDADDLMKEMFDTAKQISLELGKNENIGTEEAEKLYKTIGLGALKYFILKVDPKKNMLFNPAESIDFNGNTGSFIQYTYARIQSVLRKAEVDVNSINISDSNTDISEIIRSLIHKLYDYASVLLESSKQMSPALICNYVYELASLFNKFYQESPILKEQNEGLKNLKLLVTNICGKTIEESMQLLGIDVPERM